MSHSKRNTSLAFFTAHERSLLRSHWGSQSARLTRESFLPFGYCRLCLNYARDPVTCSGAGSSAGSEPGTTTTAGVRPQARMQVHLFCRECALNDLMAQRKEVKRLEKESEARERDDKDDAAREEEERRRLDLERFERNELGFADGVSSHQDSSRRTQKRQAEELHSRRRDLDAESAERDGGRAKKQKTSESSFWTPGSEASSRRSAAHVDTSTNGSAAKSKPRPHKLHPTCPASTPSTQHNYSLKSLIAVNFTLAEKADSSRATHALPPIPSTTAGTKTADSEPSRICPSCKKALTNTSRAMLGTAVGCGHVICGGCAELFIKGSSGNGRNDGHGDSKRSNVAPDTKEERPLNDEDGPSQTTLEVACFVCSADLGGGVDPVMSHKHGVKNKDKEKYPAGKGQKDRTKTSSGRLVEISCEGTGFAGGGANMAKREGVAFKC